MPLGPTPRLGQYDSMRYIWQPAEQLAGSPQEFTANETDRYIAPLLAWASHHQARGHTGRSTPDPALHVDVVVADLQVLT